MTSGRKPTQPGKVASFAVANCKCGGRSHRVVCTSEQHPLYACQKFKAMSRDEKLSSLRKNNLCLNCLGSGHFVKLCRSSHWCKKCQQPHHTLLHISLTSTTTSKWTFPHSDCFQCCHESEFQLTSYDLPCARFCP